LRHPSPALPGFFVGGTDQGRSKNNESFATSKISNNKVGNQVCAGVVFVTPNFGVYSTPTGATWRKNRAD
jgi:hypothetical protein